MIVVADASPLHYIILVGHVEVLPQLFDRVLVPPAVISELSRPKTPDPVHRWTTSPPTVAGNQVAAGGARGLGTWRRRARGHRTRSSEIQAEAILIDDRDAVKEATKARTHCAWHTCCIG